MQTCFIFVDIIKCLFHSSTKRDTSITESHRIIGVGRDFWKLFIHLLLKQVLYSGLCKRVLNISKDGNSTGSLGNFLQYSITLQVNEFSLGTELPVFQCVPSAPYSVSGHLTEKCLAPSTCPSPTEVFLSIDKIKVVFFSMLI